ncbi:hypothetical protein GDO86_004976 [Hymenochirus boettgeri]|uniref:Uncharacterized protein n=1 Tax=Hymenochirus boettgeri TaxID=247094 RepID=A0A8T2J861_9PIPI|nr:hypothetical protein GDO86_004976 [Hymenochirus boettgeri]
MILIGLKVRTHVCSGQLILKVRALNQALLIIRLGEMFLPTGSPYAKWWLAELAVRSTNGSAAAEIYGKWEDNLQDRWLEV